MSLDSALANDERLGNGAIRRALRDQGRDLALALCQAMRARRWLLFYGGAFVSKRIRDRLLDREGLTCAPQLRADRRGQPSAQRPRVAVDLEPFGGPDRRGARRTDRLGG